MLTRIRRFHGYRRTLPERYLTDSLTGRCGHFALIGEAGMASCQPVVALASCVSVGDGVADIGVLVEDRYQRQGIGSALLQTMLRHADRSGIDELQATVLADQEWLVSALRCYGRCSARVRLGVFDVTLRRMEGDRPWIS